MIEPIGIIATLVGFAALLLGLHASMTVTIVFSLFGAAAGVIVGAANIQPCYICLAFLIVATLSYRRQSAAALLSLRPFGPGFWLLSLTVYGVLSAYTLPRLLAGITDIVPLGSSQYDSTGGVVPLGPVSSNLTQSVYMVANLICFALMAAVASTTDGFKAVTAALIAFCVGDVVLAVVDLVTWLTHTQSTLSIIRNAQYTLHVDDEIAGMKRVVGSFTEASAFARYTLGVFGFSGTLWLAGYRPLMTGTTAFAAMLLVVLSTSSTGLAGLPIMLALLYATAFMRSGLRADARFSAAAVVFAPLVFIALVCAVLMVPKAAQSAFDFVNLVVLDKSSSDSGIERSSWNAVALNNFFDTWGLGTGLGTGRTSSSLLAVLSNVGIPGTILYFGFLATTLLRSPGSSRSEFTDIRRAARNGCLGLLLGDLLVSPVIDHGLFFFALAAVATARPAPLRSAFTLRPIGVPA